MTTHKWEGLCNEVHEELARVIARILIRRAISRALILFALKERVQQLKGEA